MDRMEEFMTLSKNDKSELILAWCFSIPAFMALFEINTKFVAQNMSSGGGEQNAALFPRLLSYLLLFFIILKTAAILLESQKRTEKEESEIIIFEKEGRKRLALIFFIFAIYLIGLTFLGYYAATPLALAAFFIVLGLRKPLLILALSLGVTLVVWYSFGILLKVVLPVGQFGLYF